MFSLRPWTWMIAALGSTAACAAGPAELRVTRVALFSSGVAYFECEATVKDNASATLNFRTDQVNDIIKSLMVKDLGGGKVGVVSYASQDPVEKALKSFGVDITGKPTLAQLLDQLRGERVQIAGPRTSEGVILGVEKRQTPVGEKGSVEVEVLSVLTAGGIEQVEIPQLTGVKLLNESIDAELRKALATLATSRDAGKKSVVIGFDGAGERKVRIAYLLEAPIWKTSYRIMLSPEGKPFLQGWATVENATEEDWKDVGLSLVSGRPISFTMDLYTPLYIPRPREELELYASLRPPSYEGAISEAKEVRRAGVALLGARGRPAAAAPMAEAAKRLNAVGYVDKAQDDGDQGGGVESVASAREAGELFEYAIQVPVSIARQHSAMLPIVNQEIEGEKVSIYNPATHAKHPLNGLHLKNTSGLNLMQGPVTLFDGNVYAGDAKLPDLKPDEKRLIGYALDLGVEVDMQQKPASGQVVHMRIAKGTLIEKVKHVDLREYVVKNKEKKQRTLLIEQFYGDDWTLIEPKEPLERTRQLSRFKVPLEAGATTSFAVRLEQVIETSVALTSLDTDRIQFYLRGRTISKPVLDALEKIVALRSELDRSQRERAAREKEVNEAVSEQARVRENIKTLDAGSDARRRQEKKFDEIETQIEGLRKTIAQLRQDEEQKRQALENYLLSLNVE